MVDLPSMIELVKGQLAFHREMAERHAANERRQQRHLSTAQGFDDLLTWIEGRVDENVVTEPQRLALSWDEIEDLPPELIAELSVSDGDKTEFQILSALERLGGVGSLDRIIVELWKATGEVHKRPAVTNRLYRMGGKGMIISVSGKKGVYALESMTDEDIARFR